MQVLRFSYILVFFAAEKFKPKTSNTEKRTMTKKNLLAIGFMLAISLTAYCRPARRMPFTYTQPDGTEITLRTVGDENFHYVYEVSTGRPVVKHGATYRYAELDADGTVRCGKAASGSREKLHDQATNMKVIRAMKSAKANTAVTAQSADSQSNFGLGTSINGVPKNFVLKGDVPCLVVLAQFADRKFTYGTEDIAKRLNAETEQLNSGEHAASARSYYMEQSGGRLTLTADGAGIYILRCGSHAIKLAIK